MDPPTKPLTCEQAAELAQALLDLAPLDCRPFGAGKFSETFEVRLADGTAPYVLRVAPPDSMRQLFYEYRMMRQEPALHRRLRSETSIPVPEILAHDFSRKLCDRDFLVMPRLPGTPLSETALSPAANRRAFREWGRHVAAIHALTETDNRFGYLGDHRCMAPQSNWPDAFLLMFRKELDDIVKTGIYSAHDADSALRLLEKHLDAFRHATVSRLLHGDLWCANLLVDREGAVTGLLDFDRACWGDIEWDLAIAEYCGTLQPSFWEGYGPAVDLRRDESAAIRRFFHLLYEHQKYIVISASARRNDPDRARRYADDCLAALDRFRQTGRPEL